VRLVHAALDMGVTVFDTAPSYGASEAHLGRALRDREAVIVTKGGYGVPGCADWTPECITLGIDRALATLGRVDVFLLHSCDRRVDLIEPLVRARESGKVGAIGYSGDGEPLEWAAGARELDVLECSINLFDHQALSLVGKTTKRILAKRALGNAPFRDERRPEREDRAIYWDRMRTMFDSPPAVETAVRFVAHSGVDCALVGTRREDHLRVAIEAARTPLADTREIRARFARHGVDWLGVV
jgi:aryl-alcohol dehydrogenase-like predicted oxidoreductase